MDQDVFASLARIRILLLPVGSISRAEFEKWAEEIGRLSDVRLSDVPTDSREDRARFMPNPLATGSLLLRFVRHPPPASRAALSLFRPSEFPLGVIGIATSSQSDVLPSLHSQFMSMIAGIFPTESIFPLAKNCFVFEEGDGNSGLNAGDMLSGMVVIPSMMGNKRMYLETLVAELCSNILGEFSVMVKTLETPNGSEALTSGLFGSLMAYNISRLSSDGDENYRAAHNGLAQHSQPDISGNTVSRSTDLPKLPLKRASTLPPGVSGSRTSTLLVTSTKKRQSAVAAVASHAKLYKVLGDLFLMSGRTMDSSIWYNEALALLKQPSDSPWQASALEGLAISSVIEASSTEHDGTTQASKDLWTDAIDKLGRSVSLYQNAATFCESEEMLRDLSLLYASACLRQSFLLYAIWRSGGWNSLSFSILLHGGSGDEAALSEDTGSTPPQQPGVAEAVPRSDIALALGQTHGPWLLHLGPRERTEVLRYLARIYAQIGYHRKEAYVLRELLACLMDLVVHGREERREPVDATPAPPDSAASDVQYSSTVGVRQRVDSAGNSSIVQIVRHICNVFDLNLTFAQFSEEASGTASEIENSLSSNLYHPFERYMAHTLDRYSWPELQLGIAREALAVAEALPDNPSVVTFALSALCGMTHLLDADDQYHFYTSSARAMATARRRGDERKLRYWPGELAVSIKFLSLSSTRTPTPRPWSDRLPEAQVSSSSGLPNKVGPFLYNPRRSLTNKQQTIVVQNENLEFVVTFHNTFAIVLELLQVTLSTSGVAFKSNATSAVLAANSSQPVTITGRALEPGTLVVRGIVVQLPGTELHETLLPVLSDEEDEKIFVRAIAAVNEFERLKVPVLSVRLDRLRKGGNRPPLEEEINHIPQRFMELKVVPEQPFLRIRRTSLTNGAVMLYEGETSIIRLSLENVSALPTDFLELTFEDSTKSYAEQVLADEEASDAEKYETEYSLVNRPVFSWDHEGSRKEIAPGKESVVNVKCFGKAGCTNGSINISYSYVERPDVNTQEPPAEFFVRQLPFPVVVTVYQMLECSGMNVVPLSTLEHSNEEQRREWADLLDGTNPFEWCLLTLDVQNTYGLPFEVILSSNSKVSTRIVSPGSTYRFFLPIQRFVLPSSVTSAPIPSLTNRQFVVTGLTNDAEKAQRELFWYREDLLKRVQASWKEAGGMRSGELSLRQQRFTQPMLNALRIENIQTRMSLIEGENLGSGIVREIGSTGSMYSTVPNKRVYLLIKVQNLSVSDLSLALSVSIEPIDFVVYEGVLRNIPLGRVKDGNSLEFQLPVMFVAQGQFKFSSRLFAIDAGKAARQEGAGTLTVVAEE